MFRAKLEILAIVQYTITCAKFHVDRMTLWISTSLMEKYAIIPCCGMLMMRCGSPAGSPLHEISNKIIIDSRTGWSRHHAASDMLRINYLVLGEGSLQLCQFDFEIISTVKAIHNYINLIDCIDHWLIMINIRHFHTPLLLTGKLRQWNKPLHVLAADVILVVA